MCRGGKWSPTLPWAARLVTRAPRHTILARRVPPLVPIARLQSLGNSPTPPAACSWLNDGIATAATSLLASNPPQLPVEGVRDPEGFAFTAVSPFY